MKAKNRSEILDQRAQIEIFDRPRNFSLEDRFVNFDLDLIENTLLTFGLPFYTRKVSLDVYGDKSYIF